MFEALSVIWFMSPWVSAIRYFALCNEKKVSEIFKAIKGDGWFQVTQRESHHHFKRPSKPDAVTIAGKPSDELAKGTQMSILKQAGLRGSEQP